MGVPNAHSPLSGRLAYAGLTASTLAARGVAGCRRAVGKKHPPPSPTGPLRVLMIAKYPSTWTGTKYRLVTWARRMRVRGHHVELAFTMADNHAQRLSNDWSVRGRAEYHLRLLDSRLATIKRAGDFDVALLHMTDVPFWDPGPPFIAQAIHGLAGRLILDLDDLPIVSEESEIGRKARALGALADGLTVGNRRLASQYPGRPYWWVPTCLEPREWNVPDRAGRPDPPLLGWVGTWGNLDALELLAPVLAEVCRRHATRVRVVCSQPAKLPGVPQEFVPWSAASEQADLEPMDIGLAPLIDAHMQRHKCGLKALQYMASGCPVVASPVGALNDIVVDGETGLLASTQHEWYHALERLITERDLRLCMGARARQQVEEHWSFDAHESTFVEALRGLKPSGGA